MLKQRIITAVVLAALFFSTLFGLATWYFAGFALFALMTAVYEWGKLTGLTPGASVVYAAVVFVLGALLFFYGGFDRSSGFPPAAVLMLCGTSAAFWILVAPVWLKQGWTTRITPLMLVLGAVLILAMWMAMTQLHARSPWLLLATMLVVWIADTAAYFAGRRFGRRKLAPVISPGKSWEGVYGGLVGVGVYAVLLLLLSPLGADPHVSRPLVVVAALVLAMVSVVGDLFESWLKRQAGVKDSGSTLPGHGGVLDRIDALLPALPVATLLVVLMS
ncbi:MAG: phosphatidate cytidylyltransferase [Betaproteobacteria bacterium]